MSWCFLTRKSPTTTTQFSLQAAAVNRSFRFYSSCLINFPKILLRVMKDVRFGLRSAQLIGFGRWPLRKSKLNPNLSSSFGINCFGVWCTKMLFSWLEFVHGCVCVRQPRLVPGDKELQGLRVMDSRNLSTGNYLKCCSSIYWQINGVN